MTTISWTAAKLADLGYTLRSGGAYGADTAFEVGCDSVGGAKEIFLPWMGFNHNTSQLFNIPDRAFVIAESLYPFGWTWLAQSVKKLMARNVLQILGTTLDNPVVFVLCWTPDGCTSDKDRTKRTGGTGQAISLASIMDIPVFNLTNSHDVVNFNSFMEEDII
jgi:hypothetical protein